MSYLYITDSNAHIRIRNNCVCVEYDESIVDRVPIQTLESISMFGRSQITTQCIQECMKRCIPVLYYSTNGVYLGRMQSVEHINVSRQRIQAKFIDTDIALELAKKIVCSKIHNQAVVMMRYAKSRGIDLKRQYIEMKILIAKASRATEISEVMGYEGRAARLYFENLGKLVDEDFSFSGRSRRPPRDPFNAMLSFGYSILLNELYGKIDAKGLNPYFGFLHRDRERHPTLASDLMEEWRAVIVDSTVMSLVNGHEISAVDHFEYDKNGCGIYLTKEGRRIFLAKMESKFRQENRYLLHVDNAVSFRRAIELQVNDFTHVLEENDAERYVPIWIR